MSGAWLVLFILLWLLCVALVTLVIGLSRRLELLEAAVANPQSAAVPADPTKGHLVGTRVAEHAIESGIVGAAGGMAGVVLFVSDGCGPCRTLADDVQARLNGLESQSVVGALGTRVTIVTDQGEAFDALGASAVIVDQSGGVQDSFDIGGTPTGIALDEDGVIRGSMIPNRFSDLEKLAKLAKPAQLEVVLPAWAAAPGPRTLRQHQS